MAYYDDYRDNFSTGNATTTTTLPTRTTTITTSGTSTGSTGSSSSGTGARARSIEASVLHGWYIECCEYYAECFRRAPAPGIRKDIAFAIKNGMTGECLKAIMDETQTAPRPSWAYCMAILRRCEGSGIKTLEDWQEDRRKRDSKKNPALNYAQREYTDDMFGDDFFYNNSKEFDELYGSGYEEREKNGEM